MPPNSLSRHGGLVALPLRRRSPSAETTCQGFLEATPRPSAASRRQVHRALGQTGRRKKYYQFTAVDDCTRLRMLRTYLRCDQKLSPVVALHALLAVVLLAGPLLKRHPVQRAGDAALGSRIDSSPISLR